MIIDRLDNLARYAALNPRFAKVIAFLAQPSLAKLALGWHDIDGEEAYAMVARESCRREQDADLEAHRKYLDIQICLEGSDRIGWRPLADCHRPAGEYEPEDDLLFFEDEPAQFVQLPPGLFVILFPEDAHMPLTGQGELLKLVVKMRDQPQP